MRGSQSGGNGALAAGWLGGGSGGEARVGRRRRRGWILDDKTGGKDERRRADDGREERVDEGCTGRADAQGHSACRAAGRNEERHLGDFRGLSQCGVHQDSGQREGDRLECVRRLRHAQAHRIRRQSLPFRERGNHHRGRDSLALGSSFRGEGGRPLGRENNRGTGIPVLQDLGVGCSSGGRDHNRAERVPGLHVFGNGRNSRKREGNREELVFGVQLLEVDHPPRGGGRHPQDCL